MRSSRGKRGTAHRVGKALVKTEAAAVSVKRSERAPKRRAKSPRPVASLPREIAQSALNTGRKILPVIMCGGSGTRLWPASRETMPKQFIPLFGARSSFQDVLERVFAEDLFEIPIVITNDDFRFIVAEQARAIGRPIEIVLAPMRRDSGPAVATAAELALLRSADAVVRVLAADHLIRDVAGFRAACRAALPAAAAGQIVTFGIKPEGPATSYGYIRKGATLPSKASAIDAFVEKPNAATAQRYVDEGYLWNSGNFLFRADVMREEIARFEPAIASAVRSAIASATRDLDFLRLDRAAFEQATKKSIDYAVMERTSRAAVVAADFGWSDIGSWDAVWANSEQDGSGNVTRGATAVRDAQNVLVHSDPGMLTTVIGVDDVAVIATGDAVLVVSRDRAEDVKQLVEALKLDGRREAVEHRQAHRPWGTYQTVDLGTRYQVKRIVVKPGGRLSLQKHYHRAEHWVVVRGTAEVTIDEQVTIVQENRSIYLPLGCVHRLVNPGKIPLELIEVQVGSYLGEDDIIRLEDVYNRVEKK